MKYIEFLIEITGRGIIYTILTFIFVKEIYSPNIHNSFIAFQIIMFLWVLIPISKFFYNFYIEISEGDLK